MISHVNLICSIWNCVARIKDLHTLLTLIKTSFWEARAMWNLIKIGNNSFKRASYTSIIRTSRLFKWAFFVVCKLLKLKSIGLNHFMSQIKSNDFLRVSSQHQFNIQALKNRYWFDLPASHSKCNARTDWQDVCIN